MKIRLSGLAVGFAALILICTTMAFRSAFAEGSGTAISIGGAYSPTDWAEDPNGAVFVGAGLTALGGHWSLRAQVQHGRYTDYPMGVGRVYFTPIELGPMYWVSQHQRGPFLQVLPAFVASNWGGGDSGLRRVRPGVELAGGVNLGVSRGTALEVGVAWLRTDAFGTVMAFDGPDQHLDALSAILLRADFTIRL